MYNGETITYFSQDELKKLFKTIQKDKRKYALRNLCIFRLAYYCGLRASEIGMIKVRHYSRQNKTMYCQRLKKSTNNTLRLDNKIVEILEKYIEENALNPNNILFLSRNKKPISRKTLDLLVKDYCKLAQIELEGNPHFHMLKHSICVHLAESGLDIKELQQWLGHKSIENTLIYFQFTSKQFDAMYNKIENNNMLV